MKYDVTYKCGHSGVLDLGGKTKDREWKVEQAQYNLCPDCYRAAKQREMEEELAKYDLPELTGTERQVKWATDIRFKFAHEANRIMNEDRYKNNSEFIEKYEKTYKSVVDVETTSKWWIENRDKFVGDKHAVFMNDQYIKIAGIGGR